MAHSPSYVTTNRIMTIIFRVILTASSTVIACLICSQLLAVMDEQRRLIESLKNDYIKITIHSGDLKSAMTGLLLITVAALGCSYTAATSLSFRPFSRLSFVSQFLPMGACFATLASATAVTSVFDTNSAELTTSPSIPKRILSMMITAAGRSTRYKDSGALKPLIPLVWILPVLLFMHGILELFAFRVQSLAQREQERVEPTKMTASEKLKAFNKLQEA